MKVRITVLAAAVLIAGLAATPGSASEPARSFTIAAAGDVLIHGAVARKAAEYAGGAGYDFAPMMLPIEPWIGEADFAICHLEGTLSPTNNNLAYYPVFNAPHEVADAIAAAGYDTCSVTGNHALDRGWTGIVETLDVLDAAGVRHDGAARSEEERLPGLYDVNGVSVAHMAYSYGYNGFAKPAGRPWAVNSLDADLILSDAAWARAQGAEFVVLSLHWGQEYQVMPTTQQEALAELLLASPDVDLILGSHVHVIQPIDRIGDKVVVYGMGNHLSNQNSSYGPTYYGTEDGVVVHITATEQPDGRFLTTEVQFTPTWVELPTYRILANDWALATGIEPQWWLESSRDRTEGRIRALGVSDVAVTPSAWPEASCLGAPATVLGTPGPDLLLGTSGPDVIVGRGENDTIFGSGGNDLICGGDGNDFIAGDTGPDILIGGGGDDLIMGGMDNDTLIGGEGADHLIGGEGHDGYLRVDDSDRFGWLRHPEPLP